MAEVEKRGVGLKAEATPWLLLLLLLLFGGVACEIAAAARGGEKAFE